MLNQCALGVVRECRGNTIAALVNLVETKGTHHGGTEQTKLLVRAVIL
jgi:hypothetical protein